MKAKEMMKKLMMIAALAGASALPMAAQAEATYDYMATVCVSHYADKDPTASDDNAKWYSVYCLTQEAAQEAMGTTDAVDYETYAAWLGENFEANKQKTIDNAQLVDLDYFERVVKNKYYFFSYYDTFDTPESPLSDALGVVFFENDDGDLAYNVLANDGEWEFNCDEENGYPSSGWKAVSPAAPIEATISDVTARQRYPWNGKVDIAYTASNVLAAAESKSMDAKLAVMAIDKSVTPWTTNVAEEACLFEGPRGVEPITTEAALSNGAHRIVWDMNAQGLSNKSDRVVFVVSAEGKKPEPGLCFTALADDSTVTVDMKNYNLEYSCDGGQTWEYDNANNGATVTLKTGDKLLVRATSAGNSAVGYDINDDCEECYPFKATGNLKLSGNVMYLLKQDGSQTEITDENVRDSMILGTRYCFQMLFYNCAGITDASELKLANNTRKYCYGLMFQRCTGLTKVPALPAMTLALGCYWGMFWECSSLVTVDENLLPATNMVEDCYFEMFQFCTALTQAPKLPATDLPVRTCYANMFYGCTSLTTAPLLGAIRMPRVEGGTITGQMANMFLGCSKLSSVTLLATEIYDYSEVNSALRNWLDDAGTEATNPTLHVVTGMANNETVKKNKPDNWTIVEDAK